MGLTTVGRVVSACVLLGAFEAGAAGGGRLALERPVVVVDPQQPSFVRYAVDDLAAYLEEISGDGVSVRESSEVGESSVIAVGARAAERFLGVLLSADDLGAEGYVLKSGVKEGINVIAAAGADPHGTQAALAALIKRIRAEGRRPFVDGPLDITGKPTFGRRGIHFNGWPFKYPHSFRRWREQDWQRYLDILSYQGVNVFYFWPFMEIIPLPLSPEDQAYLEECRRIVDYAQTRHGMEVWIMQCTNRVARDNCGVADPKARPYWRPSQEDLKPHIPEELQRILASREVLYRALNNVDAVCNIDSDPGFCPDCPLEGYVQALKGFRTLLDRWNLHGERARLMTWMWMGWGKKHDSMFEPGHQERTLDLLRRELPDTWGPVAGRFDFLELCRRKGLLSRTILLPYGVIEDEPSYPWTNVGIEQMRGRTMDGQLAQNLDLPGVIGNVQTPLLQLPHVYYFTSCLWDFGYRTRPEKDVLLELAGHLYPEHRQLVADCYLALRQFDPARIAALAQQLDALVREDRLGRPGLFGRKLFPDGRVVAQSLVLQLKQRAAQERLFQGVTTDTRPAECVALIRDCLDAYLAWDLCHGWHDFWGWSSMPLVPISTARRYPDALRRLGRCLGTKEAVDACLAEVGRDLKSKYDAGIVQQGCITPLTQDLLKFGKVELR